MTPDGMILTAELEPKRDRHAGHVPTAVARVAARQDDQRRQGVGLLLHAPANLLPPGLIDPVDHRQDKILLVLELAIERTAGVAGITAPPLQDEVGVAMPGQAPGGCFEQSATRFCAPIGLCRAGAGGAARGRRVRQSLLTRYMHACMLSCSPAEVRARNPYRKVASHAPVPKGNRVG